MSRTHSLESLTAKASPTFEQPFEMMEACHQRLDRTLALLGRLREHLPAHGADEQARQAAEDILRYFERAAPQHHQDEELHVFPPLLAQGIPATVEAVRQLQRDHEAMESQWRIVQGILTAIAQGGKDRLTPGEERALDDFAKLYESHIRVEESLAYPAARSLLGDDAQRAMGEEMQARRGGPR